MLTKKIFLKIEYNNSKSQVCLEKIEDSYKKLKMIKKKIKTKLYHKNQVFREKLSLGMTKIKVFKKKLNKGLTKINAYLDVVKFT